ncbi:MAG: gluconolaconase [Daejeonella sp.]|nr:gluconolaconase [Daejeonella sp.]
MVKAIYVLTLALFASACEQEDVKLEKVLSSAPVIKSSTVSLKEIWRTDTILKTPESVLFDPEGHSIFVSNVGKPSLPLKDGDGFISLLTKKGEICKLKWIIGLNDPQGLGVWKNKLYVTDLDAVVEINISAGKIIKRIPVAGSTSLNDITVDDKGNLYVSGYNEKKIYKITDGQVSVFIEGDDFIKPNGLIAEKNRLVVAFTSLPGDVKFVDLTTKTITPFVSGLGYTDGLSKDEKNNYFASDWAGRLYYLHNESGKVDTLLNKKWVMHTTDIDYMKEGKILLVPTYFENCIVAYKVRYDN